MNTSPNPQPARKMTRLELAQAMTKRYPYAPANWMTNAEVLELLEEIAQLKAAQAQPAPMLFTALFTEVNA